MILSGRDCIQLVEAMRHRIEENQDRLSRLDSTIGDGDHGVNLAAAVSLAARRVQQIDDPMPDQVMRTVGSTLINEMGGAAGVIFGSFFRGGSRAIKGTAQLGLPETLAFMQAGLVEVQKRGRAQPGDKTLVDALSPAVSALATAVAQRAELPRAMAQAAQAARAGAESTKDMVAQLGRAKFLAERSLGHQDAGATSMALLISAWSDCVNDSDSQGVTRWEN